MSWLPSKHLGSHASQRNLPRLCWCCHHMLYTHPASPSAGYGAAFGGVAPLLAALNSSAPGVTVVNIDSGAPRGSKNRLLMCLCVGIGDGHAAASRVVGNCLNRKRFLPPCDRACHPHAHSPTPRTVHRLWSGDGGLAHHEECFAHSAGVCQQGQLELLQAARFPNPACCDALHGAAASAFRLPAHPSRAPLQPPLFNILYAVLAAAPLPLSFLRHRQPAFVRLPHLSPCTTKLRPSAACIAFSSPSLPSCFSPRHGQGNTAPLPLPPALPIRLLLAALDLRACNVMLHALGGHSGTERVGAGHEGVGRSEERVGS